MKTRGVRVCFGFFFPNLRHSLDTTYINWNLNREFSIENITFVSCELWDYLKQTGKIAKEMKQGSNPSGNCSEHFSVHRKNKIVFRFESG